MQSQVTKTKKYFVGVQRSADVGSTDLPDL